MGISQAIVSHVVGARPNFPKLAPVYEALQRRGVAQRVVHTGQHYDDAMSGSFFRELDLPTPDVNLEVGSGSHASQTAALLQALEEELLTHAPSVLLVYGDVNSALAGALAASKLMIPVAHVESGLRSRDKSMPEEVNRIVIDHLSDLLFTTSPDGSANLLSEGLDPRSIHFVGNPMIDTLLRQLPKARPELIPERCRMTGPYAVVTMHRPANVDSSRSTEAIVKSLKIVSDTVPLVVPLHPRGRRRLESAGLTTNPRVVISDPLSYLAFLALARNARMVITDSGGVQEETTMLGVPCLTLRPNTERPVTITHGTNQLVSADDLPRAASRVLKSRMPDQTPPLWDGNSGERIAEILTEWLSRHP